MKNALLLMGVALLALGCEGNNNPNDSNKPGPGEVTHVTTITSDLCWNISTDKAIYQPGEVVHFQTDGVPSVNTFVRYRNGSNVVATDPVSAASWEWTAPSTDGLGYMAEVYRQKDDTTQQIIATIGIDVSSDWHLFPRYGFVATFDRSKTQAVIESEMAFLNRCHINGVQFQDWHWKHHYPAPIKNGQLLATFKDIANRDNSTEVIKNYIAAQHAYGMKAIFYNLCFGALEDRATDGVKKEWGMFCDNTHTNQDRHDLPSSWKSSIYLLDPSNAEWLQYIGDRNQEVYDNFDFDGYQIDQLGYRGDRYTYAGQKINFNTAYAKFVNAMYQRHPDKDLIMNAVGSFGAQAILETGHMALAYNECWGDEADFSHLRNIVKANDVYSAGMAKTVFAAYMDYNRDNCEFNIPGVLLTDAVMFALGGSHLELGDHMLCREYFPYTGVRMSDGLKEQIIRYYDFLTAYENILRSGDKETTVNLTSDPSKSISVNAWPPKLGKVTTFARKGDKRLVIHLLNFLNANSTSWRDMDGTMPAPRVVNKWPVSIEINDPVNHVYVASPDYHGGALVELPFTHKDGKLSFVVPSLKYWDMIVIE